VIFENSTSFLVAEHVLASLSVRPYDVVVCGNGHGVFAVLEQISWRNRRVHSVHYVGDIDYPGLAIAIEAQQRSVRLGLLALQPATELHRAMLRAGANFRCQEYVSATDRFSDAHRSELLNVLDGSIRPEADHMLRAGYCIEEDALSGSELRDAWSSVSQTHS
jgi:hypothetical protein